MLPFPMPQGSQQSVSEAVSQQARSDPSSEPLNAAVFSPACPSATTSTKVQSPRRLAFSHSRVTLTEPNARSNSQDEGVAATTGESFTSQGNANPLTQSVSPLSANVSKAIKEKIWAREFIKMGSLLSKQEKPQPVQLQYDDTQGGVSM